MVIIRYFILSVLFFQFSYSQKVNWITIEKAQELQKKVPKNIIMDVYTNWCGPCKLMDKYTFQNPDVCLLYTSPSPRDRTRSRMPSSA